MTAEQGPEVGGKEGGSPSRVQVSIDSQIPEARRNRKRVLLSC